MKELGNFICKYKYYILVFFLLLLIPTFIGIKNTKINYDILVYLPDDVETVKGENILSEDFGIGSYAISIIDNMNAKDVLRLEEKIKEIDGVGKVVSIYDVIGTTIPVEMLPSKVKDNMYKDNETILFVTFNDSISSDETINAVTDLRKLSNSIEVGGMSSMVLDTRNLSESEVIVYVSIAVILCVIVLMICLDSYVIPFILLANIGIAILYNMGSNIFLGNISYITKSISSILQLGVTMDFSIFLYHKYMTAKKNSNNKEEAMSKAIKDTFLSVIGSSLTTIAGFLALCTMNLTLGMDIGIVMAKGVLIGVICVIFLFPVLILIFDNLIERTKHKEILPEFKMIKNFVVKHYVAIFIVFLILIIPAFYGQLKTNVYYNLDSSLPDTLESQIANKKLKEEFGIVSPEIILVDKDLSNNKLNEMTDKLKSLDGMDFAVSYANIAESGLPTEMLSSLTDIIKTDKYQLVLTNSKYENATDELNNQISKVNEIVKSYDENAIVAGEGPLMKDLTEISDQDFTNVTYTSLAVIFVLMVIVLKSISLPVILVCAIEFAIFINMGIPYYTNVTIPFIASIVIGTIQLGATIDYAILMTTKYLEKRKTGTDKMISIKYALDNSVQSIIVSGLCFFAATIGVGFYSKLEMISSLCTLISRGAIISMIVVIMVLPSLLVIFDKIICKTTKGFKKEGCNMNKKIVKATAIVLVLSMIFVPTATFAKELDETVYTSLDQNGNVVKTTVSEHLINTGKEDDLEDDTILTDIVNINGDESFVLNGNKVSFKALGKDIYYQGTTTEALPISLNATYTLDGQSINPDEAVGKQGHVEISLNYINNQKENINGYTLYTPFVVAVATTLNTKDNSNINVTNGKIVSTGETNAIAAIASPGLYESLGLEELKDINKVVISFDTTNFALNDIYSVATCKMLEESDLDSLDKINGVFNKVSDLQNASSELVNGTNTLANGLNEYTSKFAEFKEGVANLDVGTAQINDKYADIDNAINQINGGLEQLNAATTSVDQLSQAIAQLAQGTNDLSIATSNLNTEIQSLNTLITNHLTTLGNIASTTTDSVTQASLLTEINDMQIALNSINLTTLKSSIDQINIGMQTLNAKVTYLKNNTATLSTAVTTLYNGSTVLVQGSSQYKQALSTLSEGSTKINNATGELYKATSSINEGAKELAQGQAKFNNEGIGTIVNYINNNVKSISNKVKYLKTLSDNYNSFASNTSFTKTTTKIIMKINATK